MYRIDDKESIKLNGSDATMFKLYEYSENHGVYVFIGKYTAHANATDDECVEAALNQQDS